MSRQRQSRENIDLLLTVRITNKIKILEWKIIKMS